MNGVRNRIFFLLDLLLIPLAVYLSYVLRLEVFDLGRLWPGFTLFTLGALIATPLLFFGLGLYSRYWRYASVGEVTQLVGGLVGSTLIATVASFLIPLLTEGLDRPPRSIPFLFLGIAGVMLGLPRLAIRLRANLAVRRNYGRVHRPALIVGAGDAGTMIQREYEQNPQLGIEVVGYIDDDPQKQRVRIRGIPVLGTREDIPEIVRRRRIERIVIAMPTMSGKEIRPIVEQCERAGIQPRIIPGVYELLDGTVKVNQLREVNIEDLLRRDPVRINSDAIAAYVGGRRVLVTGGGGSIGAELCRQIAALGPEQLIVLGHGENSLFHVAAELKRRFPKVKSLPLVADIRDRERLDTLMARYRPEIIYHAAAHKHVPLMELNPCEAVTNNVLGTRNLVELAEIYNVPRFVMVSTDKAVNPTSVMGASKRAAERIVHMVAQRSGHAYVAVRFGNVLGSRGSVVPFFKQQIAAGGPVTVTHPEMRRFFMTIPEAVALVLQAATLGHGGEVFVLDMGEPVRIMDLARDLIRLSGLRPDEDIEIRIVGLRPGEKLYEELFIEGESYRRTTHEKIFVAENASSLSEHPGLMIQIDALIGAGRRSDDAAIRPLLQAVVPEYDIEALSGVAAAAPPVPMVVTEDEEATQSVETHAGRALDLHATGGHAS